MAGILAVSASKVMIAGDTAVDKAIAGFITREQIVLATTPTGSSYSWGLSIPQGSTAERSGLSDETAAAPTITPDVAGEYVATCTVDGTFYVLRISVTSNAVATIQEALRLQVKTNASIARPPTGSAFFHSDDFSHLAVEDAAGAFRRVGAHRRGTATWDPGSVADGAVASTTVTVTGAVVGDTVSVGFSTAVPAGALLFGAVTVADTVTCTLMNKTGAPLDLASGTLKADVWQ